MKFKLQLCLKIPKNSRKIIVDFVQAKQSLDYWNAWTSWQTENMV